MSPSTQLELFDAEDSDRSSVPVAAQPPEVARLARELPAKLYLGTSSWAFPGWKGLVYGCPADRRTLARRGLAAYARHPLLRTVSLDRSYYGPIPPRDYRSYLEAVPARFRFLVKAPQRITSPILRDERRGAFRPNADYLDPAVAQEGFLKPLQEGLGGRLGAVVLQFPPQGRPVVKDPARFAEQLGIMLEALKPGALCAVELRDPQLLTPALITLLARTGAGLCVGVHPRAPDLGEQLRQARSLRGPLIVRWNLGAGLSYEDAKARYAPFDRLRAEDLPTRRALAEAAVAALGEGRRVFIAINNKAEGSAPLSVLRLAREIGDRLARAGPLDADAGD